jgi:ribosome-associated toxin RatA of RatAB toxin-antitoxin module
LPIVHALVPILVLIQSVDHKSTTRHIESRKSAISVEAIGKVLDRGELALVESNPDGSAAQIVLFSKMNAAPEKVYDTVADVEKYPEYMKSVVRNKIIRRQGDMFAYEWELDVPIFNLKGVRMMRGRRPELLEAKGVSGNFKESKERWEFYPLDGGKKTLAAFYRSVDIESAGLVMKTMIKMEPSMEHGANLAAGFVYVRDVRRRVENLPDPKPRADKGEVPAFHELAIGPAGFDLQQMRRLLEYGQLALIESNDDGSLRQVALLTMVDAPKQKLASVVYEPAKYPEFIPNLAKQKVTEESKNHLKLEYELEVPMVNLEGTSKMTIEDDGSVDVVAVDGDIKRGRWRWEFNALSETTTVPVHYAYSDVSETSWFVKKLIEKQPLFEHGIVVAASTVAVRAMKARAEGKR